MNVPPGIASTNQFLVVGWDDTRNGSEVTQTQDLFTVDVQLQTVGGGTSKAVKIVLSAVAGLVLVGLVLLVVSMVSRRSPAHSAVTRGTSGS